MALTEGTRLGSYVIAARIGAGGMGEVYRARDTRLGRDVAIKTLPHALTTDPERLARLEQHLQSLGIRLYPVSAATGAGLGPLLEAMWGQLASARERSTATQSPQ